LSSESGKFAELLHPEFIAELIHMIGEMKKGWYLSGMVHQQ